jgi:hypothetical protein
MQGQHHGEQAFMCLPRDKQSRTGVHTHCDVLLLCSLLLVGVLMAWTLMELAHVTNASGG